MIVFLAGSYAVQAQEEKYVDEREKKYIDDQPQDVYNPHTTLFTTQANLQHHLEGYKTIAEDTTINGLHRFTFLQRYGNQWQNLGNNGTAAKPIFYVLPSRIGATPGFYVYDIYFRSPEQFRYYDTKSPYSHMYVVLARFGSFLGDICHSRNVTPNWNIGASFRHMMTDIEWIPRRVPGDRNVISNGLDLFTHYRTDDESYQFLAHALLMDHRVRETGGIHKPGIVYLPEKKLIKSNGIESRLYGEAETNDTRKRFHLYHQWMWSEPLGAYHELQLQQVQHLSKFPRRLGNDWLRPEEESKTASQEAAQGDALEHTTDVWHAHNELGCKGDWQDLFYSGYYRHKNITLKQREEKDNQDLHEHYLGLRTRYNVLGGTDFVHLSGEYMFEGLYKARLAYEHPLFDLACERVKFKPPFLAQHYHYYHRRWDNEFIPPTATQLSGGLRLEAPVAALRPHASLTWVQNHIYFQHFYKDKKGYEHKSWQRRYTIAEPKQDPKYFYVVALGTDLNFSLGFNFHWDNELTLTKAMGPSAKIFRMPIFLANSKLYYARTTEEDNAALETGIDVHWKASYKADAYDPVTQQFYLQDEFDVFSYPVFDLFFNFRIKSFNAFIRVSHVNEYLFARSYFVTPLYPGQYRALDIGINWLFFD
ncbi:MAG: putative porin [Roseivirga sp.]